jgi:hypothetical protein
MTDLLSHLIDAPLANILILAGLAFLAIAVLGSISGKIEPGTSGRVMSGVLGGVLLAYGIYVHSAVDTAARDVSQSAPKASPPEDIKPVARAPKQQPSLTNHDAPPTAGPLAGNWINDNPQTRGITKLDVEQKGDAVTVHAWGACHPQDCDWGTENGLAGGNSAGVAWDQGFVLRKMTVSTDSSRLRMEMDSVYRDGRPPQHAQEFFVKRQ